MFQNLIVSLIVILFTGIFSLVFAQTPDALKPSVITGDVVSINTSSIELRAPNGMVSVAIVEATKFMKVPASAPSQRNATPSEQSAIKVGDRLMVTGILAADGRSIPARSVFLMSQDDIAEKNKKEADEWRTRGITDKVISANAQTNQLVVETRTLMGSTNVTVTPKASASFMRYAPDSIRFDEAKTSSLTEIAAGDMIRALGDRSSDGTSFTAERIVTGAFQTIAGTVKSIDADKNEVVINNLATNKDLTIVVADITTLKRFPAEMAERMAGGGMGGGPRPVAPGGAPVGPPAGGPPNGGMGGMRGGSVDDMIDRFPSITVADLKVGDVIAISSTKNGSDRIRAIKLLAGVEPFIRMAQAAGAGRGRGSAVDGGFTIPGLDGIGF
jgi:hypothetical protein